MRALGADASKIPSRGQRRGNDRLGLSQIDLIGADRVMWASDYPHSEGSYGYGRQSMKTVVDMVGEEKARAILGRTALELFRPED